MKKIFLTFLVMIMLVAVGYAVERPSVELAQASCEAPTVSFTNDGFGFEVDGPCALSYYTPTFCGGEVGEEVKVNGDDDDFSTVLLSELVSINWKAGPYNGTAARECSEEKVEAEACTLPLYEKDDRDWSIVRDGASGLMSYNASSLNVEASGLEPNTEYSLIEYPEPQTTWPWPVIVITTGTADGSGNLSLSATYSVKAGEKYWIVLSSHIVDGNFTSWDSEEYLFEGFLIPDDECLDEKPEEPLVETACTGYCETPTFPHDEGPPKCTNGDTTKTAANVHVVRNGADATVNFFITEGDSANIYYGIVGQPHWQHAVADLKPNSDGYVSYTIHELDPNGDYDFGIQQKNGCSGGQITSVVEDSSQPQLFRVSYYE